jgi:hypothetical protein
MSCVPEDCGFVEGTGETLIGADGAIGRSIGTRWLSTLLTVLCLNSLEDLEICGQQSDNSHPSNISLLR